MEDSSPGVNKNYKVQQGKGKDQKDSNRRQEVNELADHEAKEKNIRDISKSAAGTVIDPNLAKLRQHFTICGVNTKQESGRC